MFTAHNVTQLHCIDLCTYFVYKVSAVSSRIYFKFLHLSPLDVSLKTITVTPAPSYSACTHAGFYGLLMLYSCLLLSMVIVALCMHIVFACV